MDHLVCFLPGLLALGWNYEKMNHDNNENDDDLDIAKELMETCYKMYELMPTGLSAEIAHLNQRNRIELIAKDGAHHSLLRPETLESLFILWRVTHDEKYREYAWNIFRAMVRIAYIPSGGFSSIKDVTKRPGVDTLLRIDNMESFFMAETLKYLYLIFSDDDFISLNEFVFNTEAHPFPIWK